MLDPKFIPGGYDKGALYELREAVKHMRLEPRTRDGKLQRRLRAVRNEDGTYSDVWLDVVPQEKLYDVLCAVRDAFLETRHRNPSAGELHVLVRKPCMPFHSTPAS